jgi:hypothetical protein
MKKSSLFFIAITSVFLSNCKKEYACECINPGGKYVAFSTNASKTKANQKCTDYYNKNFGHIPMNETFCEIK